MEHTRTAACSCGQLHIEVPEEPLGVVVCHCIACQRRTGSAFAALAVFTRPWAVRGKSSEYLRTGESGDRFRYRFCPVCGSTVFHTRDEEEPRYAMVSVGCFGDPLFPQPQESHFDCRRHPWLQMPKGIVTHERNSD
jgi:hypothetical protein